MLGPYGLYNTSRVHKDNLSQPIQIGWWINTFTEVYAANFVLSHLAQHDTTFEVSERSWTAIDRHLPISVEDSCNARQRSPFQKLLALARARRKGQAHSAVQRQWDGINIDSGSRAFQDHAIDQSLYAAEILEDLDFTLADPF
jgi:hypothetical protein